jgi:arsenate reductase
VPRNGPSGRSRHDRHHLSQSALREIAGHVAIARNARAQAQHCRLYENPASAGELKAIIRKLGVKPRELMRKGEPRYAELGLKDRELNDDQLIALMAANPILIERPIVVAGGKAAIGRPPEKVLQIL